MHMYNFIAVYVALLCSVWRKLEKYFGDSVVQAG